MGGKWSKRRGLDGRL
uniref:Truncated nef protein n=1 Tax=Human immunodeficiency virus type 1 TaxID=11676 RepID=Q8UM88_HV1|nr:truncated nef protein [Human immunodeficiency virus 1]AAL65347.1 truncated nef protein [Human immunodeficiency virus 1]AAL65348.1 truncated nef protein [Human immunodeficiency virus 1]AAL65349.1 truncated nef protein [Human immunodeficiency virus 1]AAL65350.1 truncated nef protein [Human immunodeficiency virus 1]